MNKSSRLLKAVDINGKRVFTVKSEKAIGERMALCAGCAKSESLDRFSRCPIVEKMDSVGGVVSVGVEITYCALHEPVVGFQGLMAGFEGEFNTFRPGKAWGARLIPGTVMGLLDTKKGSLFGKASVIEAQSGPITEMLAAHAAKNHLMKSETVDHAIKLRAVLSRIYGPRIINDDSHVSVINLRRL